MASATPDRKAIAAMMRAQMLEETPQHEDGGVEGTADANTLASTILSSPEYSQRDAITARPPALDRNGGDIAALSSPNGVIAATKSFPPHSTTGNGKRSKKKMADMLGFMSDGYGYGDTQPIDSQLFKELGTSVIHTEDDNGLRTYQDGETGHVDLVGNWESDMQRSRGPSFVEHDINGESPMTQLQMDGTSDRVSYPPETPAVIGQKRNYHGEVVSSVTRTPASAVAAIFGNNEGKAAISLTQAFNATQAASSPLPGAPRSDPIFERPSPTFQAVQVSSPQMVSSHMITSSPSKAIHVRSDPSFRSTLEPRNTYRTMKESQELREQRRREQEEFDALKAQIEEGDFVNEIIAEERKAELRRRQEHLEKLNSKILYSDMQLTTPATTRPVRENNTFQMSDYVNDEEEDEEDGEEGNSEPARHVNGADSTSPLKRPARPKPAEGGVQVPMTSSRPGADPADWASTPAGMNAINDRQLQRSSPLPATNPARHLEASQPNRLALSQNATSQIIAVADSQPENRELIESLSQPAKLVQASSGDSAEATASQLKGNAHARLNSQARKVLQSSLPKPPALSSSPQVGEGPDDRIPSSPPLLPFSQQEGMASTENKATEDEVDLVHVGAVNENVASAIQADLEPSAAETSDRPQPMRKANTRIKITRPAESDVGSANEQETGQQPNSTSGHNDTHSTNVFETAATHLTGTPHGLRLASQTSGITNPSPSKVTRSTRKLTDIAADSSVEIADAEVDVDFELLTERDKEFSALMSGSSPIHPSRKRRKVYGGRALHLPLGGKPLSTSLSTSPMTSRSSNRSEQETETMTSPQDEEMHVFALPAEPKRGALKRPTQPRRTMGRTPAKNNVPVPQSSLRGRKTLEVAETPQMKSHVATSPNKSHPIEAIETQAQAPQSGEYTGAKSYQNDQNDELGPHSTVEQNSIVVPNRVFALFKGSKRAYYPATYLGPGGTEASGAKIRFDDGTVDSNLDLSNSVRSLSLRIGDLVKVDLSSMRTKTYAVCGFKDKTMPAEQGQKKEYPITDVHGYETVVLAVKPRESMTEPALTGKEKQVDVPMTSIYITQTMWARFNERLFRPQHPSSTSVVPVQPLAAHHALPETPRTRRVAAPTSRFRESSVISHQGSDLFASMAFTLSFSNEKQRDKTSQELLDHGGQLLSTGFDCLFQLPNSSCVSSPNKTPRKNKSIPDDNVPIVADDMTLCPSAENLGFVALLTDTHSRRAKYMQALALGLPCLHYRWLSDCIAQQRIVEFSPYLLPAGESAFLNGAVRSRVLAPYDPLAALFSQTIDDRDRLLSGRNVLLVMGKGKAEEKRKAYVFLTYALGAAKVVRVQSLEVARKMLEEGKEKWDWCYVGGDAEEAEGVLFGDGEKSAAVGKKRKRVSEVVKGDVRVKVVSDEFVIQSLILGALMD